LSLLPPAFPGDMVWLPFRASIHDLATGTEWLFENLTDYTLIVMGCSVECAGLLTAGYATFALPTGAVFAAFDFSTFTTVNYGQLGDLFIPVGIDETVTIANEFPLVAVDACMWGIAAPCASLGL
jgi:hypothetical protein